MALSHPTIEGAIIQFADTLTQIEASIEGENLLEYNIPDLLLFIAGKVGNHSTSVIGKVFRLLKKLSSFKAGSEQIIESDGVSIISRLILFHNEDPQTLLFGSQILASLAQVERTKTSISNTAMPCLIDTVEVIGNMDDEVYSSCIAQLFSTLSVFALCTDANKILISSSSIPNVSKIILERFNNAHILGACASMIANVSYKRPNAAHYLLTSGIVSALIKACAEKLSIGVHDNELEKVMIAIANVSNSQENSSLMYSIDGTVDFTVRLLQQSDKVSVIRSAANACITMSWDCNAARRHFCHAVAIEVLMDVILRMGMYDETKEDKEESKAAEAATCALIILAMDITTLQRFEENVQDFQALIELYLQTDSRNVLLSGSMFVSVLLPSTNAKRIFVSEGRRSFIENQGGGRIIERCMNEVFFCDEALCPPWFLQSISILNKEHDKTKEYNCSNGVEFLNQSGFYECIEPASLIE